ncbi:MAG: hypothetical protein NC110_01165, partial [Ruminococcus sp.]|nr:hypothetical protein [Ruminococcus sp.]
MKARNISAYIVSVFMLLVLTICAASAKSAEVAVKFEELYAKPGTTLHAKTDGIDSKNLSYAWY